MEQTHNQTENALSQPHPAESAVEATQESLDTVRDILFGAQLRDTDRRFQQIQEKLSIDLAEAREETRKSLASLEAFLKSEIKSISDRLNTEASHRTDAFGKLAEDLKNTAQHFEKRVSDISSHHASAEADLRNTLLDQSQSLRNELNSSQSQINSLVEKLVTELRTAKTDRTQLASLFSEMAGKLKD